jgi:hypothetical protein
VVVHEQCHAVTRLKTCYLKLARQAPATLRPHGVGGGRVCALKQGGAVGVLTRHAFQ